MFMHIYVCVFEQSLPTVALNVCVYVKHRDLQINLNQQLMIAAANIGWASLWTRRLTDVSYCYIHFAKSNSPLFFRREEQDRDSAFTWLLRLSRDAVKIQTKVRADSQSVMHTSVRNHVAFSGGKPSTEWLKQ